MVDSATVLMEFESATYLLEQLSKTFNELVSQKDDLEDMVQLKDIEEYFHNLGKSLKKRFDELEEKENAFVKKELETHAFLAKRDAVVAVKEQALLDRVQEIKDAAVLTIVEAQKSYKPTSQDPDDVGVSTEKKCWEMAPRAIDVGWMYCTKINNNRLQTKCNFGDTCHYGGGVTRHKQHLAGGYANVQKCTKCPLEISRKMQEHLARSRAKGNQREDDDERLTEQLMEDIDEYRGSDLEPDDEDVEMVAAMRASREEARAHEWEMRHGMRRSQSYRPGEGSGSATHSSRRKEKSERVEAFCRSASVKEMFEMFKDSGKGKTKNTDKGKKKKSPDIRDMADPAAYRPRDASQRRIEESLKSHSLRARMGRAISRWFHSALIPAHKAKDPHFKAMVREIQRCGPNVTPPTPYEISGTYLDEVVVEVKEYIERFKEKWPEYGVTIMCDGWSGPTRLSIINFLVFCDGRTIFHKSVNASAEIKDAAYLYRLMDEVVEEIGEENVVQIVTDNAANFKKAGLSLMQKRQHIYWTPCAAHCMDLIFKDIGEIKKIQDLVSDARRITNFIYNHTWVLALMRSHTLGDLVRPASTRFATNYVALSSLLERMDGLVQMFTSQEWFCSTYASSEPGRYVQDLVTSTRFWAKIRRVTGLMQPLFSILREVDGDKDQTMGILMDRMLRAMMTIVQLNTSESQKVAKIIGSRLGGMLLQDIHRAASYLNPTLQYQDARLGYDVEMLDALRRVINRMEPDTIRAAAAVDEGIFLGCSALCSSGEGNGGCESKDNLSSQRQNYADRVPKLDVTGIPKRSTVDIGTHTPSSKISSHCQSDLSGHCNSQGSLANNQMMSCDVNGVFAGLRKVNSAILNLPQHPTLPVFPPKVKAEYPDNGLVNPERDGIDSHVGVASELNTAGVPMSGLTDSGGIERCSKYASDCQCNGLSVDFNRRGFQRTDCICSNQMTVCKAEGDSFGPKHVSVYQLYLPHCPTLSTFPIKVKVENCENGPLRTFGDGTDGHVGRVPELNAAEVIKSGVSVDSGTVPPHSKNTWGCGFGNLPGDHNSEGTLANGSIQSNQMIPYDANGDLVGPGNVDFLFNKTHLPTFSNFPVKVKVEPTDNGIISQYGGSSSGHGDKGLMPDSAKVSAGGNGITLDSCMVTQCSQNASSFQYRDLSGDCSRPGTAANDNTCSNQMTGYEAKGVGLREVDINSHNLHQLPTLPTFPVKVKVEYSDNELISPQEEGINSYVDGDPEQNSSSCSQNASKCQYDGFSVDCNRQMIQAIDSTFSNQMTARQVPLDAIGHRNVNVCVNNLHEYPAWPTSQVKVKVEGSVNNLMGQGRDVLNGSFGMYPRAAKMESEINGVVRIDDLDHILLKERRNLLLSRNSVATVAGVDRFGLLEGISPGDALSSMAGSHSDGIIETKMSEVLSTSRFGSSGGAIAGVSGTVPVDFPKGIKCGLNLSPNNLHLGLEGCGKWSSETTSDKYKTHGDQDFVAVDADMLALSSSTFTGKMKVEIMENGSENPCLAALGTASNYNMLAVEDYQEIPHEFCEDEIDHMILRDRIKLLISRKVSKLDCSKNLRCSRKTEPSVLDHYPTVTENSEPRIIKNRRKRKKTVTDSVETALEEDAPGLLQVLVDKGIAVDEIKLYGGMKEEDVLDDSSNMDNFGELEDVISKVFSQSSTLFKFAPIHCTKGSKTSYCLACLISLVEQTHYLQFRKWPVEWGWCRDLQSFIFVFERHNRIVLERPEYGYATYFFELVDSLPIEWQIKRLVTAMKLASCSRIAIIENKSLLVGEDLTEGEARVLEKYGWAPNTGLGSMLNYCDRVVHDRKNERDGSEWKSKIGKLLMDGYNGGTIVLSKLPKKVMEYMDTQSPKFTECKVGQNPLFIEYKGNQSPHTIKYEGTQSPNIKLEFS